MKEIHHIEYLYDNQYLEYNQAYAENLLANFCMPTLLKVKPSSLIRVNKKRLYKRSEFLKIIQVEIDWFECRYYILYESEEQINLLIYNENLLVKILDNKEYGHFIARYGYDLQGDLLEKMLSGLRKKFEDYYHKNVKESIDFPHEIGMILGYPLKDVEDFIKFGGKNYIICGYWKVYHNKEEALKIFDYYKKMREHAIGLIKEGRNLKEISLRQGYL